MLKAVEIKSLKTGIYVACWRRQHSFCKEKSCLADLLELWCMVIRAWREDPADAAQSGFENGSDKVPHQKLHLGTELATGWEERLLENWRQDRTESVPKPKGRPPKMVTSSMTGISQSMQKVTV